MYRRGLKLGAHDIFQAFYNIRNSKDPDPWIVRQSHLKDFVNQFQKNNGVATRNVTKTVYEFLCTLSAVHGIFVVRSSQLWTVQTGLMIKYSTKRLTYRQRRAVREGTLTQTTQPQKRDYVDLKLIQHDTELDEKKDPINCFHRRTFLRYIRYRNRFFSRHWGIPKDVVNIIFCMVDHMNEAMYNALDQYDVKWTRYKEDQNPNVKEKRLALMSLEHAINLATVFNNNKIVL
jgi:uncharacterized membrane protein YbaN (DUF454 family)